MSVEPYCGFPWASKHGKACKNWSMNRKEAFKKRNFERKRGFGEF